MKVLGSLVALYDNPAAIPLLHRDVTLPIDEIQPLSIIAASLDLFIQRIIDRLHHSRMMQHHEGHTTAQKFFTSENAASYDSVARYATFGQDSAWKRKIVEAVCDRGSILELACGTGILSKMLVQSGRSVVGLDLTFDYLLASRNKIDVRVSQGTAEALPYREGQFDAIVSSYLAKYVDVEFVVKECLRVLRPGGIVVFHDFTYPEGGGMRKLWKFYFSILRLCGFFAPSWKTVFNHLDSYIENSRWVLKTEQALHQYRFSNVSVQYLTAGTAAIIIAEKP